MHEARNNSRPSNTSEPKVRARSASLSDIDHTHTPPPPLRSSEPVSLERKQKLLKVEIAYVDDVKGRIAERCLAFKSETKALKHLMDIILAATSEKKHCSMYNSRGKLCVRFPDQHFVLTIVDRSQDTKKKEENAI